mmetsp:Transcript_28613/g.59829  ORF Transcript_28613/g.59829 Transcript_28613/m.59829 type:complete len:190 (-) Transcript_28613:324-893(-)
MRLEAEGGLLDTPSRGGAGGRGGLPQDSAGDMLVVAVVVVRQRRGSCSLPRLSLRCDVGRGVCAVFGVERQASGPWIPNTGDRCHEGSLIDVKMARKSGLKLCIAMMQQELIIGLIGVQPSTSAEENASSRPGNSKESNSHAVKALGVQMLVELQFRYALPLLDVRLLDLAHLRCLRSAGLSRMTMINF